MDFKKLIPDFGAIAKTEWAKPHIDTKDKNWLVLAGAALLMVVFSFIPWVSISMAEVLSDSAIGLSTWVGLVYFLFALVAVYGVLYNQKSFVFCGAALAAVLALIGCLYVPEFQVTEFGQSVVYTAQDLRELEVLGIVKIGHIGAILSLVASLATAAVAFLQIKKENE